MHKQSWLVVKNDRNVKVLHGTEEAAHRRFFEMREKDFLHYSHIYQSFSQYLMSNHWHMEGIATEVV